MPRLARFTWPLLCTYLLSTEVQAVGLGDLFKKKCPNSQTSSDTVPTPCTNSTSNVSSSEAGRGLREMLSVSAQKAIAQLGANGGYLANTALKIPLPAKLEYLSKGAHMIGKGEKFDALIVGMNRAAEKAARAAADVFLDAIDQISFQDALSILRGGKGDEATQYLRKNTGASLSQLYRPLIKSAMEESDVAGYYEKVSSKLKLKSLEDHILEHALNGMFQVLAEQERSIRRDPVARSSQLLRDVFS